jgi:hypothetical protein
MPSSEAFVATDRAGRYLDQLTSHAGLMGQILRRAHHAPAGRAAPPEVRHVESCDTHGVIEFGWGRCTLDATAQALVLRAQAADEGKLRRIQDGIAARVQKIGRRDHLTVTWHQVADE